MSTPPMITDQMRKAIQAQMALTPLPIPAPAPAPASIAQQMQPLPVPPAMPRMDPAVQSRNMTELRRMENGGSGVQQVGKPVDPVTGVPTGQHVSALRKFGGVMAKIGDVASMLALGPGAAAIPGTSLHHLADVNTQMRYQKNDLDTQQQQFQNEDTQAQAVQRRALAEQEQAKAYNLTHPKPIDGQLLFDGNKNPIGFHDGNGRYFGPNDPDLPHGVGSVLAAARGKEPTNEFELWHQQNPDAPASAFFELKAANAPEKQKNRDDQAIAIMAKPPNTRTPEEVSFLNGYDQYIAKNKLAPAQIRANVLMQMPQAVVDANDPSRLVYDTRRNAIGKEAPMSGEAAAARGTMKDFSSGTDAHTLTAINTARGHVVQLAAAADALKNGNIQLLNSIAQQYGLQTGQSAPIVFQAIKVALTGELGKAFSGGAATVDEQREISKGLNDANSPAQLKAWANANIHLMDTKKENLRRQYEGGLSGTPNFGPKEGETKVNSHGDKVAYRNGKWGPA